MPKHAMVNDCVMTSRQMVCQHSNKLLRSAKGSLLQMLHGDMNQILPECSS